MARQRPFVQPPPGPGLWQRLGALRSGGLGGYAAEAAGLLVLALALLTLLGLSGLSSGAWLDPWVGLWRRWLGWGSWLVVAGLALAGWNLLAQRRAARSFPLGRLIAFEAATFAALGLLSLGMGQSLEVAEAGQAGGLIGWGLAESLRLLFGSLLPDWLALGLSWLVWLAIFAYSVLLVVSRRRAAVAEPIPSVPEGLSVSPASGMQLDMDEPLAEPQPARREPAPRKNLSAEPQPAKPLANVPRAAELPPLDLLVEEKSTRPDERQINQLAGKLEQTLAEFGIPARVVGFQIGPTVTQFAVEPGYIQRPGEEDGENRQKVRVAQISALQRDLALALSAQRLRIQAPVPGRSYVGIEVPNARTATVRLRPILESAPFQKLASPLALALGRDVSGAPIAADLGKMPHLLVAGTTGSGKSVLMSAIAICLAMSNTPNDLRLVMLDPKMVELVRFNGLPHMVSKVETDLERIGAALRWLVAEMQRRYKLLEAERARDLASYNQKAAKQADGEHLPRIVVLIDELADLMMSTAEHTESTLVRLAQMARAVGIHLVVATQRPSTDVVTGLIKANFPARISFAVASSVDSRVILDTSGAEALLGRGDMLYLAPEAAAPLRSQGVMINDKEIDAVIDYWQRAWPQDAPKQAPWDALVQRDAIIGDKDELIEQAIEVIRQTGKSSASHLQRALRIGYPRAARLVDELEEMGVLGPVQSGGKEREVLINLDNYDPDGVAEEEIE
ncbi:MAG: hypothetical protein KIS85_08865 [Anaerolineales bacterium]|nr:hypothetical protein [Anaerolineales bacterium]